MTRQWIYNTLVYEGNIGQIHDFINSQCQGGQILHSAECVKYTEPPDYSQYSKYKMIIILKTPADFVV